MARNVSKVGACDRMSRWISNGRLSSDGGGPAALGASVVAMSSMSPVEKS
jgi:hypothetical protein